MPEKHLPRQNKFLLAVRDVLKERIKQQSSTKMATKRGDGKHPNVSRRERYNPKTILFMSLCGITGFKDYRQYLSLKKQYEDTLSGQKLASVGYGILELKIINRGNISIVLKQEYGKTKKKYDPTFTKAAIERDYGASLDDLLSKLQLQGSSFRLAYVRDENTLYINRNPDQKKMPSQKQTIDLLAALHTYKSAVLERELIAKASGSAYDASNTPKQSA